jgi:hypothetical protein
MAQPSPSPSPSPMKIHNIVSGSMSVGIRLAVLSIQVCKRKKWIALLADETSYPETHPRFSGRTRIFEYEPTFPLYPDNTNDASLFTMLKVAFEQAKNL